MTYAKVFSGVPQPLNETALGKPQNTDLFLQRYVLLNRENCEEAPVHIATHIISELATPPAPYVEAHTHPCSDEIGLVIGPPGALDYEIVLDGKAHIVHSPGSIYIPAGTVHRARALRGTGAYVCILLDPHGPTTGNSVKE